MAREDVLARTFVELADIWVDDVELARMSQMVSRRCVELFDASAAGILLCDAYGHLRVSASSSVSMRHMEDFELHACEGPCVDCFRTGRTVVEPDLAGRPDRWRRFAPVALAAGFLSVHAVPIRVRDQVIGSLNLFRTQPGHLSPPDLLAAQALAQALAISVLRQRPPSGYGSGAEVGPGGVALSEQLVTEQAKGMLAARADVSLDEALARIRRYARHHGLAQATVCEEVVGGTLSLLTFPEASRQHGSGQRS
jgi:GAF domain/ANTAR domain